MMRYAKSLTTLLAAVSASLFLAGCPKPYPNCADDAACTDHNEVCVQGQCQECAGDSNCKEGFVCDANKCVPKPECTPTQGCGPNKKCQQGKCITDENAKAPGTCETNEDCPSGEDCKAGKCATRTVSEASCDYLPILFEFNEHKLSSDAQSKLSALADCIKKQKAKLTVEGHADDRGTEEYNLQLSNKRAASVKRYLVDLGVGGGSLETVGFGENRPAQQGASESAWAANRRVEFTKR
jgi:peptidoglycan-associated lipoprotein